MKTNTMENPTKGSGQSGATTGNEKISGVVSRDNLAPPSSGVPTWDQTMRSIGDDIIMPPSNRTPTSDAAAYSIRPITGRLRTLIYEFIRSMGEFGATADEVEVALGLRTPTCTARINELRKELGVIKHSGRHRMTRSGRPAVVYIDASNLIPEDAA